MSVEKNGTFCYLKNNKKHQNLTGISLEELRGKTPYQLFEKEQADYIVSKFLTCCQLKDTINFQESLEFPTGKGTFQTILSPILKDGEVVRIVGIGRDITNQRQSQEGLWSSEKKLSTYLDKAPIGVFIINSLGNFIEINQKICTMTGYSKKDLLELSLIDITTSDNYNFNTKVFNNLINDGQVDEFFEINHKNGNKLWLHFQASKIDNDQYICFVGDITKLKESEKSLKKTRKIFNHFLDAIEDGFWYWDIQTGEFFLSDNFYSMLGYEPNELKLNYNDWHKLIHPDDLESVKKEISQKLLREKEGANIEFRAKTKSGSYKWINGKGNVVEFDNNRVPIKAAGIQIDINARKEYEELYKSIVNAAKTVSLIVTDLNGIIREFSPGAEAIFGYTRDEMIGKHVRKIIVSSDLKKIPDFLNKLKREREGFTFETERIRKSGERFPVRLTLQPLFDNEGNFHGTLAIIVDISDLKETEKRLRKSEQRFILLFLKLQQLFIHLNWLIIDQ
ncbi:putative PAS/PAC sensor protein [Natranaerobius thermophilus JW/NM-WN-LF]|uniref:histidine kinase n=1 Tax=Natranaerobius thermophilus (strain ATCC BAA-1301 / DSM 18059 / JW/NM-WN-LF) TaxID=457570 RepID=B2A5Z6_NATTJ|nr:putative PAS/PAC sensor protein [Natranaerobius thermophilus JW/NM-WN-LF]